MIDEITLRNFQDQVWDYYHDHGRHDLPWRQEHDGAFDPYQIMVSEIMLQQTQVARVIPKYQAFLEQFPTVKSLAEAPLGDVLRSWSGLGYNRRAKYLHQAAQKVQKDYAGRFPQTLTELTTLPGVGQNTAGAILAYAFNLPTMFVETNVRTVFIHHFFNDQTDIHDKAIFELVSLASPGEGQYREWYWALMDYGSFLKQTVGNANRQSKTYARQSTFAGSRRQIRGQILKLLGETSMTDKKLRDQIVDDRFSEVLEDLIAEGLVTKRGRHLSL